MAIPRCLGTITCQAMFVPIIFSFVSIVLHTAVAYSSGAPYSTCISQFPHHYAESQSSPCPFTIRVSDTSYSPGQVITVDISGIRSFTGLSLRARRISGDVEEIIGTFTSHPTELVQAYNCLGGTQNLITQRNHVGKQNVTVAWKAPEEAVGDILFTATVVLTFTQFWVHVQSNPILDSSGSGNPGKLEPVKNASVVLNFEEECGVVKGCLLHPDSCTGSDCKVAISYQMDGDYIHFELMGISEGWVAVAFSEDTNMGEDDVILCSVQRTRVSIQHGYNPAYYYERQYTSGIKNMLTMERDGKIYCRFTRPVAMTSIFVNPNTNPAVIQEKVFDLRQDWFIHLAWGYTYEGVDAINKHEELPVISTHKVKFGEFFVERGSAVRAPVQAHGCFMILAWMLFASLGMVVGRHFKDGVGSQDLFGVKLWFHFHRAAAFLALGTTVVGFVIIFAGIQQWSQNAQGHAFLGVVIMVAVIGQLTMGMLRPAGDSPYRSLYNWGHKILGKLIHILAGVELLLAFKITGLPRAMREFGLAVVIVWIVSQVFWEVGLDTYRCMLERRDIRSFTHTSQLQLDEKTPTKPNRMMTAIFVIYVLFLLTLTLTALCAVVLF